MKFNYYLRILFIAILVVWQVNGNCQTRTVREAEKKKEKVTRHHKKVYEKQERNGKTSFDIQTDETQTKMKEAHKRAKKYNRTTKKETTFIQQLFNNKKNKNKRTKK
ncbi:MAG: hypothetical protein HC906_08545 [Bacteroidales bacterium]|nr:hypothetical protein [Bacteroidales bacterium]